MRALVIAGVLLVASAAWARKGVAVDSLAPPGTVLSSVTAPAAEGQAARLTFVSEELGEEQGELRYVVDVLVAASGDDARAALARWQKGVSVELEELGDVGDGGVGNAGLAATTRGNVMIAVRRVAGPRDAIDAAARMIDAVDDARAAKAAALSASVARTLARGEAEPVTLGGDVRAARVLATGPATPRKTAQGWLVTRTGEGAITIDVYAVDSFLRPVHLQLKR